MKNSYVHLATHNFNFKHDNSRIRFHDNSFLPKVRKEAQNIRRAGTCLGVGICKESMGILIKEH